MANVARVRVELDKKLNDPMKNFKRMLLAFRKAVGQAGILQEYRAHSEFESPGAKRRRKKRETINKAKQALLEERILAGERVKAPSGVIKKVLHNQKKNYKQEEMFD